MSHRRSVDGRGRRRPARLLPAAVLAGLALALLGAATATAGPAHAPHGAQPGVYYVAPKGDDAHAGTLAAPWRTLAKAAESARPGDTVFIRAGTYKERLVPARSGVEGAPVTYAAYVGETVTIDGRGLDVPEYGGLVDLTHCSYVTVKGLRVEHSSYYGIVADRSSHITVQDTYVHDTYSSGISAWTCDHVVVDGNEVVGACTGPYQEHISISGTDAFEVADNHVHGVMPGTEGKEGICIKDASRHGTVHGNTVHSLNHVGIYVDAEAGHEFDIAVYRNLVYDIDDAMGFDLAGEQGGQLEDVRLYDNIAYGALCGLWVSALGEPSFKDIDIVNNTFVGNGQKGWGAGIAFESTRLESVLIRNNICSDNVYAQITGPSQIRPALTVDHNLVSGPQDPEGNELHGTGDVIGADPRFVAASRHDVHLQPGSPAIDAGSATDAPAVDFDGNARPQDGDGDDAAAVDIGAYEYTTAPVVPAITVTAPTAGSRWRRGTTQTVAWTLSAPAPGGEFGVWLKNAKGRLGAGRTVAAAAGRTSYALAVKVNSPAAPGYVTVVSWRPSAGGAWRVTASGAPFRIVK